MLAIKTKGQFGNQMFQYAFALSMKKKYKKKFLLLHEGKGKHLFILHKYFNLKDYNHLTNKLFCLGFNFINFKQIEVKNEEEPISQIKQFPNNIKNIVFNGFFQAYDYFYSAIDEVSSNFKIKEKYINEFNNKYANILLHNKIVVVHIRLTSYLAHGYNLPFSYYKRCLNSITNIKEYKVLFISDDINTVKKEFNAKNFYFESNSLIIDFQLLMNADMAIISNSTFSWWGVFLNKKDNLLVYAPKYWLGYTNKKEYPNGIMCNKWKWINV